MVSFGLAADGRAVEPEGLSAARPAAAEVRLGIEELYYYPHYGFVGGRPIGLGPEILQHFADDEGVSVQWVPLPVNRLFRALLSGQVDLKYPDHPTWRRELKEGHAVRYSAPVVEYVDGVMVAAARLGRGADRLTVLGTVRGFTPWDYLDRLAAGTLVLEEASNAESLIRMVLLGRIDGAYANVDVAAYVAEFRLQAQAPGAVVFDPALPYTRSQYRLSSVGRPDLVARFDRWMASHPNVMRALKDRYLGKKAP